MTRQAEPGDRNPISEYDELVQIPGLTLYDIHRKPRPPPAADDKAGIDPNAIETVLRCPICFVLMQRSVLVMGCMHRFCSNCIERCLRTGNKECPQCRHKIPSRRSLRKDANFDALIKKLYTDVDAYEAREEEVIDRGESRREEYVSTHTHTRTHTHTHTHTHTLSRYPSLLLIQWLQSTRPAGRRTRRPR